MKKIHITEERFNQAGTDFPRFYDEETDEWYEGSWDGMYALPFGYWPTDYYGNNEMFCVGDAYSMHSNACGKAAERYYMNVLSEEITSEANTLEDLLSDFVDDLKTHNYHYDEETDMYVSEDGSDEFDIDDKTDELMDELYKIDSGYVRECVEYAINNLEYISASEIEEHVMNSYVDEFDFTDKNGIDEALEQIGDSFDAFFERGRNEGRIGPDNDLISFYETEQPDPRTLVSILGDLSRCDEIGLTYEQLLDFTMIFENWRDGDGDVTACTVADYIDGNYGHEVEDEEENEEGQEIQYAKDGKTQFVPHLASQDQKREFFKDFRNTRDQAVYAPREKGGNGTLAAYHAMRYPYGENIDRRLNKIIKEEISKLL